MHLSAGRIEGNVGARSRAGIENAPADAGEDLSPQRSPPAIFIGGVQEIIEWRHAVVSGVASASPFAAAFLVGVGRSGLLCHGNDHGGRRSLPALRPR